MADEEQWQKLCERIRRSECGSMFPGAKCVVGRGSLDPRVVFVGEAPGAEEDRQGLPFVGRSGQLLDEWIQWLEVADGEFYILNVVKCRPPGNRDPTPEEVAVCEPWLERQLDLLDPEFVVAVGRFAMNFFFPDKRAITKVSGEVIDGRFCIVPHPSYFLRRGGNGWKPYLEQLRAVLAGERSVERQQSLFSD